MYYAFMKMDGIPGECTDDKHKDWIELVSFRYGVMSPTDMGGQPSARIRHEPFTIVKGVDLSSVKIFNSLPLNQIIKDVAIEVCHGTGNKQKYLQFNFKDVRILSYRPYGTSQGAESTPLEEVTFSFGKIKITYFQLTDKGIVKGSLEAEHSVQE